MKKIAEQQEEAKRKLEKAEELARTRGRSREVREDRSRKRMRDDRRPSVTPTSQQGQSEDDEYTYETVYTPEEEEEEEEECNEPDQEELYPSDEESGTGRGVTCRATHGKRRGWFM